MLPYTRNQGNTLEYNQGHETINSLEIVIIDCTETQNREYCPSENGKETMVFHNL